MANNRKVQVEIDKLLKKTSEGLDDYEELFDKFENAPNPGAKERLEADLKREIKKLQRQREQIKGYVASPEVKDTKQLEEYRRRIEQKMLAFKACEREMKTKAFSKEGLASAAAEEADSPLAQTVSWLRSAIDDGRKRIEILDYEAQRAKAGGRKAKKDAKSEAQVRLEKTQQHFYRWEALLRMVNNEEVEPEEVDDLYDNVQKVLDEETDAVDIPELGMYDAFDIPPPKPRVENTEVPAPSAEEKKPSVSPSAKSVPKKTPPATVNATAAAKGVPAPASVAPSAPASLTSPLKEGPLSPSALATAAKGPASVAASKGPQSPPSTKQLPGDPTLVELEADALEGNPEWLDDGMDAANDDTFGHDAMENATAGSLAEMASATSKLMGPNDWESRKLDLKKAAKEEKVSPLEKAAPAAVTTPLTSTSSTSVPAQNDWERRKLDLKRNSSSSITTPSAPAQPATAPAPASASAPAPVAAPAATPPAASATAEAPKPAPTPAPAAPTSSAAPAPAPAKLDAVTINRMLDMSLGNLPHIYDVERQRPYEPPNAIEPIPYFPQEVHPILACRDVYHKFDLETLFFIFYYHQKSYQQYFAAKELKSHSFRYHTSLKRWYQRREKPIETTSTSERGAYTYFDFENSWQRKSVDDFTFEYKYLEDDLN